MFTIECEYFNDDGYEAFCEIGSRLELGDILKFGTFDEAFQYVVENFENCSFTQVDDDHWQLKNEFSMKFSIRFMKNNEIYRHKIINWKINLCLK